ncbi:Molybdenum storage protein subunit beta [archaeon HR05]|nr:Molybdenum storage protein subunit beta [archaeon HR05]
MIDNSSSNSNSNSSNNNSNSKNSRGRVVIKLSGSIFDLYKVDTITPYAKMLREIWMGKSLQPIVIAGGGKEARLYIDVARVLGADESSLDEIGIEVSRLNARLLSYAIGVDIVYPSIPTNLEEVSMAASTGMVVVAGGLHPGQSTNATSALIAERVNAKLFINATDVEGIYTSDPRVHRDARLLKRVSVNELLSMLGRERFNAGTYELMDIVALKIIQRSRIPTRVVKADPQVIKDVIDGHDLGTEIVSEE